ncbi:predicted protein [Verticillium alfalfae VaMs.102]|uniref:Predicted protein n=1 Tax=Verticillium alfalfae (strain VaMs.102 / ATCC MYA-4576 / FGSC 10136) TaxID=526221 RepID=C9SA04_VERA1|nr:predicted protein [Verticillium alfalfae VaMs.102]EEY16217.1 predicted protein [Verticillium alfalfae VaMs.102]
MADDLWTWILRAESKALVISSIKTLSFSSESNPGSRPWSISGPTDSSSQISSPTRGTLINRTAEKRADTRAASGTRDATRPLQESPTGYERVSVPTSPDVPVRTVFTFRQGLVADQPPPLFTPEPVPNRAKRGGKQRPLAGRSVVIGDLLFCTECHLSSRNVATPSEP